MEICNSQYGNPVHVPRRSRMHRMAFENRWQIMIFLHPACAEQVIFINFAAF